jgi:hypothetical protein
MTTPRRTTTPAQRVAAVVVGVLVAVPLGLAALIATAAPAQATTYRYWTYWWGSGTGKSGPGWTFAKVGPAGHRVADTWVLGWRFSTTSSSSGGAKPRQSADFATLCPSLATPVDGQVRVALVVDYGTTADAPPGQRPPSTTTVRVECLTVGASSTGVGVLNAAGVTVRSQNGLICALDGYPKGECAPAIADPVPTPTAAAPRPSTTSRSTPAATTRSAVPSPARSSTAVALATTGPSTAGSPAARSSAAVAPTSGTSGTPTDAPDDAGAVLPAAAGAPASTVAPAGSPVGLVVGGLVVAAIALSAWWTSRRRAQA